MELILIRVRWFLLFLLALITCLASGALAEDDKKENDIERYKWFLTVYGGAHAQDDINDVVTFQPKFEDNAYVGVVALARELWHYKKYLSFELEGQVAKHFNKDTQWEFVGVLLSIPGGIWFSASTIVHRYLVCTVPADQTSSAAVLNSVSNKDVSI